jgi:hypothetical protein
MGAYSIQCYGSRQHTSYSVIGVGSAAAGMAYHSMQKRLSVCVLHQPSTVSMEMKACSVMGVASTAASTAHHSMQKAQ